MFSGTTMAYLVPSDVVIVVCLALYSLSMFARKSFPPGLRYIQEAIRRR